MERSIVVCLTVEAITYKHVGKYLTRALLARTHIWIFSNPIHAPSARWVAAFGDRAAR